MGSIRRSEFVTELGLVTPGFVFFGKLNMFVKSFPNWRARERDRWAALMDSSCLGGSDVATNDSLMKAGGWGIVPAAAGKRTDTPYFSRPTKDPVLFIITAVLLF